MRFPSLYVVAIELAAVAGAPCTPQRKTYAIAKPLKI
jgi:hypothetical protein